MIQKKLRFLTLIFASLIFLSCTSIQKTAMNSLASNLSGADKKGKALNKKNNENLMLPLTGETDSILMADFFPTALKLYEILHAQNPEHQGLSLMTASLSVMYANAFIQHKAEMLPQEAYLLQNAEFQRAKMHYLRARNLVFSVFEQRYPGFSKALLGFDIDAIENYVARLKQSDVEAAYWLGAAWLGAWSLDPLDTSLLPTVHSAVRLLEKAALLEPDYNEGAIWTILLSFYASAPADFGGDTERAYYAYEKALETSSGKSPGVYIAYAESICVAAQDAEGFIDALQKALAIDANENPATRLQTIIAQEKANYLMDTIDYYFLFWD